MGLKLVAVTWLDSRHAAAAWVHLDDLGPARPVMCVSVGWLVQDGADAKLLAQSLADVDRDGVPQAAGIKCIPSGSIVEIVEIGEGLHVGPT